MVDYVPVADFKEALFGCTSDLSSCLCVLLVPFGMAITQGKAVSEAAFANGDLGSSFFGPCLLQLCCGCIGATINRGKIRKNMQYDPNCCGDLATNTFCMPCAVCQEGREVKPVFNQHLAEI